MDGVVLCHLANHIRPRSVASIHVPSPAVVSHLSYFSCILRENKLLKFNTKTSMNRVYHTNWLHSSLQFFLQEALNKAQRFSLRTIFIYWVLIEFVLCFSNCYWTCIRNTQSFTNIWWRSNILSLQPKLSMAKCRRNVENFLDACKKLGVPQVY